MRALLLIYTHRVSGIQEIPIGFDPKQERSPNPKRNPNPKKNPNPKRRSNSPVRKLQLDLTPFQKRSSNLSWIPQASSIFHLLSLPTILHLGEDFSNLSRIPTNSNISSGEIDTRSRLERSERNRHKISTTSTWSTDETYSFTRISITRTINFH